MVYSKLLSLCFAFVFCSNLVHGVQILGGLERFFSSSPGQAYDGQILIKNPSKKAVTIKVSQTDYRFNSKGENFFDEPGTQKRSNAKWIKIPLERVEIPANSLGKVEFRISVPPGEELEGSFWSLILLEPMLEDDPELTAGQEQKFKIRTVSRFGVQIISRFGQNINDLSGFKFLDRKITRTDDQTIFELAAENKGVQYMRPTLWAEFFDSKGRSVGRFPGGSPQVLPGCSVKYRVNITDLPPGEYTVLVVADNGQANVVGARYKLKVD